MKFWFALSLFLTSPCFAQEASQPMATTPPQATLTWTDTNTTPAEQGTNIERKCGAETTFTKVGQVGANVATYVSTLDPAMAGQTCTFRVAAYNADGTSPYSNEASCVVPTSPLAAPTNLSAGTP